MLMPYGFVPHVGRPGGYHCHSVGPNTHKIYHAISSMLFQDTIDRVRWYHAPVTVLGRVVFENLSIVGVVSFNSFKSPLIPLFLRL